MTKKPKVGKASDWYNHKKVDRNLVDVENEKRAVENDQNLENDDSDDYEEEEEEIEKPTAAKKTKRVTRRSSKAGTSSSDKNVGVVSVSLGGEET